MAFEKSMNRQWIDAANAIKIVKDKEKDKRTKGYLCQIQAEYTNKIDPTLSQEILKAGKNLSAAILSPLTGIQYQRAINTIPQAQAIRKHLDVEGFGLNELLVYIDGVLSNLCISCVITITYNFLQLMMLVIYLLILEMESRMEIQEK